MSDWLPLGSFSGDVVFDRARFADVIAEIRSPLHVVRDEESGALGLGLGENGATDGGGWPLAASLPPLYPEWLGDRSFSEAHRVRFPYITGAMANGIATTRLVAAMARAHMLGFFGAAGLSHDRVSAAIDELEADLGPSDGDYRWGVNLIHSPNEPTLERRVADMLVSRGVTRVEASAFMSLTPAIVRYACAGLRQRPDGSIERKHHVFAKISRPEVARHFMAPAPDALLSTLVAEGALTEDEARLGRHVAIAEDVTVEADSGGHTDNRPMVALLPLILAQRDELSAKHEVARPVRVGAGGGLGTPASVAAAFQLGAAYVLTGSVNQGAIESGLCAEGKKMLAQAGIADVVMAPAADMFELGVKLQVLKRGTMFAGRAQRLYDAYLAYGSLDEIPGTERARLEKDALGKSLDDVWAETRGFWEKRDPHEVEKANANPKHKMALCFRWYLGLSSRWAIVGEASRKLDYQIWCGPAMGAFNDWVRGSFLEPVEARTSVQIALNLLEGAAVLTRAQTLRSCGVAVPPDAFRFAPRPLE